MEEVEMATEWRVVQLFISMDGVAEVEVDAENSGRVRCNCRTYASTRRCKHTKFVKTLMDKSDGVYSVPVPEEVPDEEAFEAISNPALWRQFVIKYGDIEVL